MSVWEILDILVKAGPVAAACMFAVKKINQILWEWNHPKQEQTHENANG